MSITKPYYRLWRPVKGYSPWGYGIGKQTSLASIAYLKDDRFACQLEMQSSITATHLIIRDLYDIFNYIEPHDDNKKTFSHRIYELFLRTVTEFESNCRGILKANDYTSNIKKLKIKDYFKISHVARLSEYKVSFERWIPYREYKPFAVWENVEYVPLSWYQSYNKIKHNRFINFSEANLENLMNAIAGLLCILHAQYGDEMQSACFERLSLVQNNQGKVETGTFTIIAPHFSEEEQYNFIWLEIKGENNPFQKCVF